MNHNSLDVEAVTAKELKKKSEEMIARHQMSSKIKTAWQHGHGKDYHDILASSFKKSFSQIKESVVLSERDVRERHTGGDGIRIKINLRSTQEGDTQEEKGRLFDNLIYLTLFKTTFKKV